MRDMSPQDEARASLERLKDELTEHTAAYWVGYLECALEVLIRKTEEN